MKIFALLQSVLFQFTLFLNDIKSNSDSATSKHSDKNAKIRDGIKNTIKDDLKCSSSNDSMMRTIPEKNASENNPNSKLTSTGSRSDYSSCDAKKVKIVKLQPIMIVVIQALILTLRVKMPILPLNMQVLMEMQLLKNRIMILTLKIQVLVEMETNDKKVKIHLKMMLSLKMQMKMEKILMVVKMHPKMTLSLKKTHRMLFREK